MIRELKIGDLLKITSGITYIKILSEQIPEIIPKIKVDITRMSLSEIFDSNLSNLKKFFPHGKDPKGNITQGNREFFIATKIKELVYISTVACTNRNRVMILATTTLERFRGNHINPAVLVYLMKCMRDEKKLDKIYISTNGTNISMQKSILRAGFKIDTIFYNILIFKWRIRPFHFLRILLRGS